VNRMDEVKATDRIAVLRKREQALRIAIAAERDRQERRAARSRTKLVLIIGETLLSQSAKVPDVDIRLRQLLKTAVVDDRSRQFLASQGWL